MKNLKQFYSGLLYDVIHTDLKYDKPFVLNRKIKPAWNFNQHIFGKAFTVKGKLVRHSHFIDDTIRLNMLSNLKKDTVMIYDTEAYYDVAHFGEITATIAKKAGCNGVVLDGCTRDIEAIEKLDFPIFCKDITPIDSYGYWQVTGYNCDIMVSGEDGSIIITPDDYIFGDRDSVIIIPNRLIDDVYDNSIKKLKAEERLKEKILKTKSINLIKAYQEEGIH